MSREIKSIDDVYPLTIVMDRYSGVYSGGKYLAFNIDEVNVPLGYRGDDISCADFWSKYKDGKLKNYYKESVYCGKGMTLKEATDDLVKKLNKWG
tara:strand:+ start:398 stop:682 length:285 start_codon:yes stop_codon:yes gene_type:complete